MSDSIEVRHFSGRMETPTGNDTRVAARKDWISNSGYFEIIRLLMLAGFCLMLMAQTAKADQFTVTIEPMFRVTVQEPRTVSTNRFVAMFTATFCGPCQDCKRRINPQIEAAGYHVAIYEMTHAATLAKYSDTKRGNRRIDRYPTYVVCDWVTGEWVSDPIIGEPSVSHLLTILRSNGPLTKPQAKRIIRSHRDLVELHNQLHGGGMWSWPGDLETHLRTVHGVDLD